MDPSSSIRSVTPNYLDSWSHARVYDAKPNFSWTIKNFSSCTRRQESPVFPANAKRQLKWLLCLDPFDSEDRGYISVALVQLATDESINIHEDRELKINANIGMMNSGGEKIKTLEFNIIARYGEIRGREMSVDRYVERDFLFDGANGLLPNDELTIFCEMCIKGEVNFVSETKSTGPDCGLPFDYLFLFESSRFSDVVISCADKEFQAHKFILSSRLTALLDMMDSDSKNRIIVSDIKSDVLEDLIKFIYSGKAPCADRVTEELLSAAIKFGLDGLKSLCEKRLAKTPTNLSGTGAQVTVFRHIMKIHNFSSFSGVMDCPAFPANSNIEPKFHVVVNPKPGPYDTGEDLRLFIRADTENVVISDFEFSILNIGGVKTITESADGPMELSHFHPCGFDEFVKRDLILEKANELLQNDVLTLCCEIKLDRVPILFERPDCGLSTDFSPLCCNSQYSDVLICLDDKEFPAHKFILAARSPAILELMSSDTEQGKKDRIVLSPVKYDVFRDVIEFIYSGREPNADRITEELLSIAIQYKLDGLKAICEESIATKLSIESVVTTLIMADSCDAKLLKSYTIAFIWTHQREVMETDPWKRLSEEKSHLLIEVLGA